MAGSSFAKGETYTHFVDLQHVNKSLEWNPYRKSIKEVIDADEISENELQEFKKDVANVAFTKQIAENCARYLLEYHAGRLILQAEEPGEYASEPRYWLARARFYQKEYDRLRAEHNGRSRSSTPLIVNIHRASDGTELGQAKHAAGNAARGLVRFPTGESLLLNELHGDPPVSLGSWWSMDRLQGDAAKWPCNSATQDSKYWWDKATYYREQTATEEEKDKLDKVKHDAENIAKELATLPGGEAIFHATDLGPILDDLSLWHQKKKYYEAEIERLRQQFWTEWRSRIFDGERTRLASGSSHPMPQEQSGDAPDESISTGRRKEGRLSRASSRSATKSHRQVRVVVDMTCQESTGDCKAVGKDTQPRRFTRHKDCAGAKVTSTSPLTKRATANVREHCNTKSNSPPVDYGHRSISNDNQMTINTANGTLKPSTRKKSDTRKRSKVKAQQDNAPTVRSSSSAETQHEPPRTRSKTLSEKPISSRLRSCNKK